MNRTLSRIGALSLLALAAIGQPVHAQNTTANAGAQSGSAAQAASGSQAGSAAIIQQTFTGPPESRLTYGGGTQSIIDQRLSGTQTIRNVPQVYAPALGGTNPCTIGGSAGGAVAGFGITLGAQFSDQDCERRNAAALAHNMGQTALAQEILCGSSRVREARQRLAALGQGALCAEDILAQQTAARTGQPIVTPAPVVTPVSYNEVMGGGAPTPRAANPPSRPDWCDTASAAERRQYRSTCG